VTEPLPSPMRDLPSRTEVYLTYLRYFRSRVIAKVEDLPPGADRRSPLPSGWTPLELIKHLTHVERRWLEWGFAGEAVADPWAEQRGDRWHVGEEETLDQLRAAWQAQAARSEAIVSTHDLAEPGAPGPRWDGEPPATLERILLHLVQEFARHTGHLDVVVELEDGSTGE
jgi:uncharacterized damage-inducible protein DinB